MAKKLDPYRETARMVLEPWLVEAALARLGRTLSIERSVNVTVQRPHDAYSSRPCSSSRQ